MIYIMRHSIPDYSHLNKNDYIYKTYLAPLTKEGINITENMCLDELKNIDIIVSSPYTRALQTASIVAKRLNKNLVVEPDLHEWLCDTTGSKIIKHFGDTNKLYKENIPGNYETNEEMKIRFSKVLEKYKDKNILIVAHSRLLLINTGIKLDFSEYKIFKE